MKFQIETKTTMKTNRIQTLPRAVILAAIFASHGFAQTDPPHQHSGDHASGGDVDLAAQVSALRMKVQRIEAQLDVKPSSGGMGSMGKMKGMGGMGMMNMGNGTMEGGDMGTGMQMGGSGSGMSGMGMGGMGMGGMGGMRKMSGMGGAGMAKGMGGGMKMMGMMRGMGGASDMSMPSALPGFPGASHLYHIGSTGFFLDHAEHVKLTVEQRGKLGKIKEDAALGQATLERKIEDAEQELWQLTASGEPEIGEIEAAIRAIEKLRGDQRLEFIRAVGRAAEVLSHDQHLTLAGEHGSEDEAPDHSQHQPVDK